MARRRRNLYLYLALACFFGLIAVLVFDGYIGVYDRLTTTSGEREINFEEDRWDEYEQEWWGPNPNWGDEVFFSYEIDNRTFREYNSDLNVSLWQSQNKLADLTSDELTIASFEAKTVEWSFDTAEFLPEEPVQGQAYNYTVKIMLGEVEHNILISINPVFYEIKPAPAVR